MSSVSQPLEGDEDHIATSSLTFLDFDQYNGDTQGSQYEYNDFSLSSQTQSQTQQLGATLTQDPTEKFTHSQQNEPTPPTGNTVHQAQVVI